MKHLLLSLLLLFNGLSFAQTIERDEVIEDLTFLKEKIKEFNPALPIYHPEFDSRSSQLISEITEETANSLQHFSWVSQLCVMANEGHFQIHDWEDEIHQGFGNNTYAYLPIQVKIVSKRIFLYGDFSNEQLMARGDEILAINGMKAEAIMDELQKFVPSDGLITTYANLKIEDGFYWLYYLYIQQPDSFEITFLNKDKIEKNVTIKALVGKDRVENLKKYYPSNKTGSTEDEGFYSLDFNDNYALLSLPSFDFRRVNKYNVKSDKMYKTIFKELQDKGVTNLVIDLRDNTGGRNEFADDIIPYILKSPSTHPYFKKTISWEGKERVYKMPRPSKMSFQGKLYVLVNGKTYSAGSSMARYLKEYGDATVIGTEAGTRHEGFAAGSSQDIQLPNSGFKIGIPRYHILYHQSTKQKTTNRGLLPDFEIEDSFERFIDKSDPYIDKVISLIESEN